MWDFLKENVLVTILDVFSHLYSIQFCLNNVDFVRKFLSFHGTNFLHDKTLTVQSKVRKCTNNRRNVSMPRKLVMMERRYVVKYLKAVGPRQVPNEKVFLIYNFFPSVTYECRTVLQNINVKLCVTMKPLFKYKFFGF